MKIKTKCTSHIFVMYRNENDESDYDVNIVEIKNFIRAIAGNSKLNIFGDWAFWFGIVIRVSESNTLFIIFISILCAFELHGIILFSQFISLAFGFDFLYQIDCNFPQIYSVLYLATDYWSQFSIGKIKREKKLSSSQILRPNSKA